MILEKRVPEELYLGADNTPKETKNKCGCWWCMWLLCVMLINNVPLHSICLMFLLVGHTHDDIDRFFSRLHVAIAGRNYYTVAGLMKLIVDGLPGFNIRHSHLHTVWAWKDMADLDLPVLKGLRRVHAVNLFTHKGAIFVKWKHYLTSEQWSHTACLIPAGDVSRVASWRPSVRPRRFAEPARMHAWVDKYETKLAHSHDAFQKHKPELDILRQTIDGKLPEYADGPDIETIIADIIRYGQRSTTDAIASATLPHDAIVQLFPGGDLPETGVDTLIEIPGIWQPTAPDDILGPGSMVICRPTLTMHIGPTAIDLPFSLGMAIPGDDADDYVLVSWWVPGAAPSGSLRAGKKAKVIDIFGPWEQYDELKLETASSASVPSVRVTYAIDVSAISLSLTHRGNLYRAHVLQTGV